MRPMETRPPGSPANLKPLRVAIVPGVNPGKWTTAWSARRNTPIEVTPIAESDQRSALIEGRADIAFVRLPIDPDGLSVIRLYEEVTVVVVPNEHPISVFDAVTTADLDGETIRSEPLEDAIDLVVAGAGILVLPHSLARQHARRDLATRPITDAPATQIAIAWITDATTEDVEEFVGIVRGRTAASSRGASPAKTAEPSPRKQPARPTGKKPAVDRKKGRRPR
ncbi:LysR substrate-binding domain-containing protein [Homoserinimonas sp. A447]